jgi:hypothetical protein
MVHDARIWLNWRQWWETAKWLFYTLAGSLLPVWGSCLLLKLFSQKIQWTDFFRHGEFALYSAAIITPAIYLILKEKFNIPFLRRHLCGFLAFSFLIFSTLIFAGVTIIAVNQNVQRPVVLNESFLVHSSIVVFCLSVFLVFFVTLGDNLITQEDLREVEQRSGKKLEKDFDALGGTNE